MMLIIQHYLKYKKTSTSFKIFSQGTKTTERGINGGPGKAPVFVTGSEGTLSFEMTFRLDPVGLHSVQQQTLIGTWVSGSTVCSPLTCA